MGGIQFEFLGEVNQRISQLSSELRNTQARIQFSQEDPLHLKWYSNTILSDPSRQNPNQSNFTQPGSAILSDSTWPSDSTQHNSYPSNWPNLGTQPNIAISSQSHPIPWRDKGSWAEHGNNHKYWTLPLVLHSQNNCSNPINHNHLRCKRTTNTKHWPNN